MRVVYDPESPEQARLAMLSELRTGPLVFGTVALGLYILGGAFACFGWMVPFPEPLPAPASYPVRAMRGTQRERPSSLT